MACSSLMMDVFPDEEVPFKRIIFLVKIDFIPFAP
jgi:hypothetical protein